MPRAYWKGYLRLSLVTCPIELFPATSQAEKTHFHQINTQTGHRLRQQMVDEETGRVIDAEHKGRGYELSAGWDGGARSRGRLASRSATDLRATSVQHRPAEKPGDEEPGRRASADSGDCGQAFQIDWGH
jgi:Ku70/Ku80 beta-barrel domain